MLSGCPPRRIVNSASSAESLAYRRMGTPLMRSTQTCSSTQWSSFSRGIQCHFGRSAVRTDGVTTPSIRCRIFANSSMKEFAIAPRATACLSSSCVVSGSRLGSPSFCARPGRGPAPVAPAARPRQMMNGAQKRTPSGAHPRLVVKST
jgi:hypothetical protein